MLDIQQLRKDLPAVVAGLKRRGFDFDEAGFRALEDERKKLQSRTEELQAKRNVLNKQVGMLKGKGEDASGPMKEAAGIGDELKGNETALAQLQEKQNGFLRTIQRPGQPLDGVDERTSLVEAGLIDSLAVLEIVSYLEKNYRIDFAETGVDPEQLTSTGGILDLIERFSG